MAKRIAVVLSQGQSHHPAKRALEEAIVGALLFEPGIDVTVVSHLYDLAPDSTGMLALRGVKGNLIVLSWLYDRSAFWVLDRNSIRGHAGRTLLRPADADDGDEDGEDDNGDGSDDEAVRGNHRRVLSQRETPNRHIYCIDLRSAASAEPFVEEIKRILRETTQSLVPLGDWLGGDGGTAAQRQRYEQPINGTALATDGRSLEVAPAARAIPAAAPPDPSPAGEAPAARRWYPVIDYSRCTNCMECIDFCLFGVYGVDRAETILVEQPDNCRKGCPACSRVCPENAIIFPQHKTPAIAGAPIGLGSLKIDLSKLFGAPDDGKSAAEIAAIERDEHLVMAGRDAVGASAGLPKRQVAAAPKDELDDLIDALDASNL